MSKLTYLIKRASSMNLEGLKERLEQVQQRTGRGKAAILADMLICGLRYEAGYIDYTIFGMYDMTHAQRKEILTRGKNTRYVSALNKREDFHYFNNKSEFLTLFKEECGRDFLDLSHADAADFEAFISRHATIMAKPEAGLCGKGIEKISTAGESPVALYNSLKTNGQTLIEEVLTQHEQVSALYPGAIDTVRMVTMTDEKGKPHLVYAAMRLGSGGAVVDNFNSGGMVIPVDPEKGTLTGVAVNKAGETFEAHPDTGVKFHGYQLPCWEECRSLAFRAAVRIPTIRFVGWDLAITPKGPVLVEGNHFPGHDIYQLVPQNPEKKGMLPVFDAVVPYSSLKKLLKNR
ncbi:MAG: hypothetical protein IJ043_11815 [Clostridia bacterium]|nr:hypothetical protein [Clostridia bacterium]